MRAVITACMLSTLSLLLVACASAPRTEAEALAKYESDEKIIAANIPENYRLVVADELRRALKDPYSIRGAEISRPGMGFVGIINGGQGIVVCARLNAKNSFGAYTGVRTWGFAFRNRMIVAHWPEGNSLACQGRAYFPFPELVAKS